MPPSSGSKSKPSKKLAEADGKVSKLCVQHVADIIQSKSVRRHQRADGRVTVICKWSQREPMGSKGNGTTFGT